jgi:hypothetical protein
MRVPFASAFVACLAVSACSQTPVVVPLRSMERPRDLDFICLEELSNGAWQGVSLEKCALNYDDSARVAGRFRLHSLVTQQSRGELAVVDLGRTRPDTANLVKVDPRTPGYSFIPVSAAPTDVVADPMGEVVFVSSGRDPRIDVLPSGILRGPIDTTASVDPPPWPHLDFDRATEGMPSAMSIVREKDKRRLFVTLPDAKPAAKIAVFDLASARVPSRVGDITLGAPLPAPLPYQPISCGPNRNTKTWWAAYDTCGGEAPKIPSGSVTVDVTDTNYHFAGVALAGGKLFVSDDRVPVIHVFEVANGAGVEIRRIAVGTPTARLAVSPVVPDEVTFQNSAAIDVCTARGWIGDGKDHSAESPTLAENKLTNGRCRAHRYIYAVDLVNTEAGGGSIAVIDVPVVTAGGVEKLDLDGSELVQPMACDSPNFPARRLPLGPFAVGGVNAVPARAVAFVELDPPLSNFTQPPKQKAVRCRGWDPGKHPLGHRDLDPADGVSQEERDARIKLGTEWRPNVDPRRLRGVFAWVALSNGALVVVDVDDYDATCRGPAGEVKRGQIFRHPDETDLELKRENIGSLNPEYFPSAVRRHHPRSLRAFTPDLVPAVTTPSLTRFGTVLSNEPTSETGSVNPHFAAVVRQLTSEPRPTTILPAPDNPYALSTESWTVTYEGALPGFTGSFGALLEEPTGLVIRDPSGGFCRKGVESDGAVDTHDVVQLLDEVCTFNRCTPAERESCLETFGDINVTTVALPRARSLLIEKAFDDRLTIANKHLAPGEAFVVVDGPPDIAKIKRCFGDDVGGTRVLPLLRYTVRSSKSWVVVGGTSGFLHRKIVDPASTDKVCINDLSRPRIQNGRAFDLSPLPGSTIGSATAQPYTQDANVVADLCKQFVNPVWKFAIRRGIGRDPADKTKTKFVEVIPQQDMRFAFSGRFAWQPLSIGAGSLSASIKAVASTWDGVEQLNWRMVAVVDAIDRGLLVFPADQPFAFQKGIN